MTPLRVGHFLGDAIVRRLLDFVAAQAVAFGPATVGGADRERVDTEARVSWSLDDLGTFERLLQDRVLTQATEWLRALSLSKFSPSDVETQLVAYGDGGFYRRHVDVSTGSSRNRSSDRLLTAVYYFHHEPKGFSGGALRLGGAPGMMSVIDVEPEQDLLVVFPAWWPHEVLPVRCQSGAWIDSRFSINCWVHRERGNQEG